MLFRSNLRFAGKPAKAEVCLTVPKRCFTVEMKEQEVKTMFLSSDGGDIVEVGLTEFYT